MPLPGFIVSMKQFFGTKEGQTTTQFAREVQQLSYAEKLEFYDMLNEQGIACERPSPPQAS